MANPRATRNNYGQDVQFNEPIQVAGTGGGHGAGRTYSPPSLAAGNGGYGRGVSPGFGGRADRPMLPGVPAPTPAADPLGDIMRGGNLDDGWKYAGPGGLASAGVPVQVDPNGFADAGPLVPFGRGDATSAPQAPLDDYENYVSDAVVDPATKTTKTDVKKSVSKPRTKSGRKAKAKATQRVQSGVKQEQKKFATVDPLNLFGNKNGENPFNSSIKGDNRFSGGDVRMNDRNAPGGRGAYGYNDEIMNLF